MASDVIAIVLAGGRSRRMGAVAPAGGKAGIQLAGESMLGRVCRVLTGKAGRVIVVAADGQPLPSLPEGVEVARDTEPDCGPLAAIRDGLAHALATGPQPAVVMLASCDVPDLKPGVVRLLVDTARKTGAWVVPVVGGHPQVLVSAMSSQVFDWLTSDAFFTIKSPRALLDAMTAADARRVFLLHEADLTATDSALASFVDIDTPDDLAVRERSQNRSPSR
jgi:molybdopterin-guanine dinucleotide biosynthesis protein A